MTLEPGCYREGKATFHIEDAFYRPHSQVGRDLAVLAAAVYRHQRGQLRVLDAMTGCGVRPLRYQLEAEADWVWANEGNPDLQGLLARNLARGMRPRSYRITHQEATQVLLTCYQQRDFYDLVDIDSFGSGTPFLAAGLLATRVGGLLYLTNTDTRTTGGRNPEHSVQMYGAYARSHPAVHEQGLRLLLGRALQQAASQGMGIQPVFSLFNGQVHRVMVRLVMGEDWPGHLYGFVGYCHHCGHYQVLSWRDLGKARCDHPGQTVSADVPPALAISGPMWLGPLHDRAMLHPMAALAINWGWRKRAKLIQIMQGEAAMPPYYYPLGEVGRRGKCDIPSRDRLIAALKEQGFEACATHLDAQALKTNALLANCIQVARSQI
ncbi:MAG: tRNA (guanine-N1)-methyltransferase [Leptolyngbya sp. RL_3_1]|nr:tRNA (guanine-N1)-methyltransferase [Leptolyngbya sp. RL_3_1]